jgi:hypothetical protein
VGIPERTPVVVLRVMPLGSVPEVRLHFSGAVPPVVKIAAEYGALVVPAGRVAVVIASAGFKVMVMDALEEGVFCEVAVTVAVVLAVSDEGAV